MENPRVVRTKKFTRMKPMALSKVIQDDVPIEVVPGIFIGSVHCAFNDLSLTKEGITHVVNLAGIAATFPSHFSYLNVAIRDKKHANLLGCVPAVNHFITAGLRKGGVLVHCSYGRSRSAAFVSAYLMQQRNFSLRVALELLKSKRSVVDVNEGFLRQLVAFEAAAGNVLHAHQLWQWERAVAPHTVVAGLPHMATTMTLQTPDLQGPVYLPATSSMDTEFVCKGCDTSLFHSSDLLLGTRLPPTNDDGHLVNVEEAKYKNKDKRADSDEVKDKYLYDCEYEEEEEEADNDDDDDDDDDEDATVVVRLRSEDDINAHLLLARSEQGPLRARKKCQRSRHEHMIRDDLAALPRFLSEHRHGAHLSVTQGTEESTLSRERLLRHSSFAARSPRIRPKITNRCSSSGSTRKKPPRLSASKPNLRPTSKNMLSSNNDSDNDHNTSNSENELGAFLQRDSNRIKQVLGNAHLRLSGMQNWIHAMTQEATAPSGDLSCPKCDSALGKFDMQHSASAGTPPVYIAANNVRAILPRRGSF